jgi:hypothetical protein
MKMTKAHKMARATARLNGWDPDRVFRARDTQFTESNICYVIRRWKASAIVIYGDDFNTTVSTGNHPGRFVKAPLRKRKTRSGAARRAKRDPK